MIMGFCGKCGAEVNDEKYCPVCGTAIGGEERSETMAELERLINYFKPTEGLRASIAAYLNLIKTLEAKNYTGLLLFSVIWVCFVGYVIFKSNPFHILTIVAFLVFTLPGIVAFLIRRKLLEKNNQKIKIAEEEKYKLWDELCAYYEKCERCPLGIEYTDPTYLENLYDYVRSGKASTIQGAMNCYEEDLHRERVEKMTKEALDKANEALDRAKSAEKTADRAEWNSFR